MTTHPAGAALRGADVLPFPAPATVAGDTDYCRVCDDVRVIWHTGRCSCCGQLLGARVGDECSLCGGEAVVDGLVIGDEPARPERCHACRGTGRITP